MRCVPFSLVSFGLVGLGSVPLNWGWETGTREEVEGEEEEPPPSVFLIKRAELEPGGKNLDKRRPPRAAFRPQCHGGTNGTELTLLPVATKVPNWAEPRAWPWNQGHGRTKGEAMDRVAGSASSWGMEGMERDALAGNGQ